MTPTEPPTPTGRPEISTQRGRKRQKIGATFQRVGPAPRVGPPRRDTRPPAARQPKGPYLSVPDTVVDQRPPVPQKPLAAAAEKLLAFYYRLNTFVVATEEKAPVEWAARRFLGVRKARAYAIQREIAAHTDLEAWFRRKALDGMRRGRIGRGRATRPSRLADAFFIALAGGESAARSCARCLAGQARADLQEAAREDRDEAASEVRDYMVHSQLLWRLSPAVVSSQ
jgi:hypothetical protein